MTLVECLMCVTVSVPLVLFYSLEMSTGPIIPNEVMECQQDNTEDKLLNMRRDSTSWYEFLLQPGLLLQHISNPSSVPGSHQLIIQFLQQANMLETSLNAAEAKQNAKETQSITPEAKEESDLRVSGLLLPNTKKDDVSEKKYFKKKIYALKLLALKIAAHGNWNLEALMKNIPGPLVLQLLQLLMTVTSDNVEENDESLIEILTQNKHSDHYFFSLLLYQRWCLQTVLKDCLPKKPSKVNSIPVPGLTEPIVSMVGISEEKLAQIKKLFGKCKSALTECLNVNRTACIPTYDCFDFGSSALGDLELNWQKGDICGIEVWGQQIAFDLGAVYFYETDYYKALDMFKIAHTHSIKAPCTGVEVETLSGYIKACNSLVHQEKHVGNIINVFNDALKKSDSQALVEVLEKNLVTCSLPRTAADHVSLLLHKIKEENVNLKGANVTKLDCLCCILHVKRGDAYCLLQLSESSEKNQQYSYLVEKLSVAIGNCSQAEKSNLISFLDYLLNTETLMIKIMLTASEKVKSLLSSISSDNSVKNTGLFTSPTTQSLLEPQSYDVSDTIIALTYNPDKIWHFLCTLHSPAELKTVADFWKLPKELDKLFTNELKMDLNSVCAYILIAKAKELILTKEYSQAVILLEAAEKTVRNAVKIQR
ncbi:INTS8 [Bugula neritina]|uniref:INTS8 n=1 Tax=Bugula neritina TaxID=10212 RepID=A0A7J7KKG1_BUGNE|nr:INTS8 [Bugula neritina]